MRNYLKGLYIEIISQCNEKCVYCYNEKNMTDCEMLPYGTVSYTHLDIIDMDEY